jgi:hypothetical protein
MKRHDELMAEIESELAAFERELDEYERTLETVENVLEDSKLNGDTAVGRVSVAPGETDGRAARAE